jgi:hypothetical protein
MHQNQAVYLPKFTHYIKSKETHIETKINYFTAFGSFPESLGQYVNVA